MVTFWNFFEEIGVSPGFFMDFRCFLGHLS